MVKVNAFLAARFKKATQKLSKMAHLVELSSKGNLSSFTGVFRLNPLNAGEKEALFALLEEYKTEGGAVDVDLPLLSDITAEVKAIHSQALLLHGERIKRAQLLFKNYREGAFSAWLLMTYGNRQTPYNFLQYYELYTAMPQNLQSKFDEIPRQALYTLASRDAPLEQKQEIIAQYQGQTKQELLSLIRNAFPLAENDKRAQDNVAAALALLQRLYQTMTASPFSASKEQKKALLKLIAVIKDTISHAHE